MTILGNIGKLFIVFGWDGWLIGLLKALVHEYFLTLINVWGIFLNFAFHNYMPSNYDSISPTSNPSILLSV